LTRQDQTRAQGFCDASDQQIVVLVGDHAMPRRVAVAQEIAADIWRPSPQLSPQIPGKQVIHTRQRQHRALIFLKFLAHKALI
jgi:hypothetical protein